MNVFLAMYFAIIEFAFSKIDCQYPILYNTFVRQKKFCCFPIINDTVSAIHIRTTYHYISDYEGMESGIEPFISGPIRATNHRRIFRL